MGRRGSVLDGLGIDPAAFVVEVGAGTIPFRHTKLIVDKHPFDDAERSGPIAGRAPVVQADAERLPLKRGSCDVLFASHVIEHLADPRRFVEEATRCAKRLYLEFPRARRELLYAWRYHRWLARVEGSRIVLHPNDVPQLFGGFFHEHYDFLLDAWTAERHEELNAHWFGDPAELRLELSPTSAFAHLATSSPRGPDRLDYRSRYADEGVGPVAYPWGARLKIAAWALMPTALVRARGRRRGGARAARDDLDGAILARLLCQACRDEGASLAREGGEIACRACGQRYRAREGVFDFDLGS